MKLKDKVAIVTGSSRGIGKAIALGFAKEGAKVVIAARTEVENERMPGTIHKTAEMIRAMGGTALPVKCDLTIEQDIVDMVKKTLAEFGRIDILVNNAGIAYFRPAWEMPLKRWDIVLRINLTGAFVCAREVLPKMMEQKSGSIINISSIDATKTDSGFSGIAYGVSKAGLERFTKSLASEVGKYNIAVNSVRPRNGVDSEGFRAVAPPDIVAKADSSDRMVKVAIFLAGQDATRCTGMTATDEEYCNWHGIII